MEEHEVLELLLTHAIPRVNVNPQAHALINKFGSLQQVLDASVVELCTVEGIGQEAAYFLHTISQLPHYCAIQKMRSGPKLDQLSKVGNYLCKLYEGVTTEQIYALYLDNGMRLIDVHLIDEGNAGITRLSIGKIASRCLEIQATRVILAHNHPHGLLIPSRSDHEATEQLAHVLNLLNYTLVEHILVAEGHYQPILRRGDVF